MKLPSSLDWCRTVPGGPQWLDRLPRVARDCAEKWQLELGEPLAGGMAALVLRVACADGAPAVLKLGYPDDESEHEAAALEHWDGDGAVRLLRRDASRRALLIEWCEPGSQLWSVDDDEEATRVAASVLRVLHAAAPGGAPFLPLAVAASRWAEALPAAWEAEGRPFECSVLDEALRACHDLALSDERVLLHQDFHGGNVIRSARGWVAIDPKPLVGDPSFDTASLLRDRRWKPGDAIDLARIRRRLDVLHDELGLDRERMRLWGVVHALAWGISPGRTEPDMIRCAELLHRA